MKIKKASFNHRVKLLGLIGALGGVALFSLVMLAKRSLTEDRFNQATYVKEGRGADGFNLTEKEFGEAYNRYAQYPLNFDDRIVLTYTGATGINLVYEYDVQDNSETYINDQEHVYFLDRLWCELPEIRALPIIVSFRYHYLVDNVVIHDVKPLNELCPSGEKNEH